ncbi:ubiquitin-conjugating enzyme E2 Z-like [Neocloeon triangulifer]|uniref:ubiquitin-conjugating enzyme E2 Z-like n=1 Tax=Neocloeon triangulifer TaxID=2078957 RepID=UPI00286F235C|nr:ubiquitin-conjugating enzyme E2 Z-like [Neocloeon triangulifer]
METQATAYLGQSNAWDPATLNNVQVSQQCMIRVKRDIMSIYKDPPPGIFVVTDEVDMTMVHAVITGTDGTPYEGGLFYFVIRFPPNYPIEPPKVKFMTTGGGSVRFNPNLYCSGKVCLSILGTWQGPAWSPAQSLESVLVSIQSLLCENPYHNEPGFERERNKGDNVKYNEIIRHETLRVAVIGMVENEFFLNIPKQLQDVMEQTFLNYYDSYIALAEKNVHMTNIAMQDPFGERRGKFVYNLLSQRLPPIFEKLKAKWGEQAVPTQPVPEYASAAGDQNVEPLEFSDLEDM